MWKYVAALSIFLSHHHDVLTPLACSKTLPADFELVRTKATRMAGSESPANSLVLYLGRYQELKWHYNYQ